MMLKRIIYTLPILVILSCFPKTALGQHDLTLYNMQYLPQANTLNPGRLPFIKGYVNLPLLSGLNLGLGSNSFQLKELGVLNSGTELSIETLLQNATTSNRGSMQAQADLLGFGFSLGNLFFTFGVQENVDALLNVPHAAFDLANALDKEIYISGKNYDLNQLALTASHYRSYRVGVALALSQKMSVGARINYLQGLENIWAYGNDFSLITNPESDQFGVQGDFNIFSSGLSRFSDEVAWGNYIFNTTNSGFSADFGFQFQYSRKIWLSASVVNLGLIQWNSQLEGVKIANQNIDPEAELSSIVDELVEGTSPNHISYQTPTPVKVYLNGRYQLTNNTEIGLTYAPRFIYGTAEHAGALSVSTYIRRRLGLTANYSIYNNSYANFGTGVSLNLGPFQLYAISDNLPGLFGAGQNAHAHMGINLTFGWEHPEPIIIAENDREEGILADNSAKADSEEAEASISKTVLLKGKVRDGYSKAIVHNIYLDVYKNNPNGGRELVRTDRFPKGEFTLPLVQKGLYLLKITAYQYEPFETILDVSDAALSQEVFEETFYLANPAEAELSSVETLITPEQIKPALPQYNIPAATRAKSAPQTLDITSFQNNYALIDRTSLRSRATHESRVLLRFRIGDRVKLLEKTNSLWWKVQIGEQTGWVKARLLKEV